MPAFAADYFGPKNVGPIYGLMLTAWSFASAVGPLFIAHMRESAGAYGRALHIIAALMAVSILLPILVRPPRVSGALPKGGAAIPPGARS
jgi:OFA family oxalate/formate antiporter-like MFS transporter